MKQLATTGIVLTRTDYGEADRILTLLTPDYGKLHLVARGVRRVKSKLAGGIELFSVSEITFIKGRGGLGTLVSTRLKKHYGHIVQDLDRTMTAYDLIKQLNKITEDEAEPEYFELVRDTFEAMDNADISLALIRLWFAIRLLSLGGYAPNLHADEQGSKLTADQLYDFSFDSMHFVPSPERGRFRADHIKFLRLAFSNPHPKLLHQVQGSEQLATDLTPMIDVLMAQMIR
jgi:DNA repair protein RecO (recombination protein O)